MRYMKKRNMSMLLVSVFLIVAGTMIFCGCSGDGDGTILVGDDVVNHSSSIHYDDGATPCVAGSPNNLYVVEMHGGTYPGYDLLWYHVGKVNVEDHDIDWGGSVDFCGDAALPAVALSDNNVVVEIHELYDTTFSNDIYYTVGILDGENRSIGWGSTEVFTQCKNAIDVCISRDGKSVIEVQENDGGQLSYRVGLVDIPTKTINWKPAVNYGSGNNYNPQIAMNSSGAVIEIHGTDKGLENGLYYTVGQFSFTDLTLTFLSEPTYYQCGNPSSVDISDFMEIPNFGMNCNIFEVHEYKGHVYYNLMALIENETVLGWIENNGVTTSNGMSGCSFTYWNDMVEVHDNVEPFEGSKLWYEFFWL